MRFAGILGGCGLAALLVTGACSSSVGSDNGGVDGGGGDAPGAAEGDAGKGGDAPSPSGGDAAPAGDAGGLRDSAPGADGGQGDGPSGNVSDGSAGDSNTTYGYGEASAPQGSDNCAMAPPIQNAGQTRLEFVADTTSAAHTVGAPCVADSGPELFYQFSFSRPVVFYADTFGASINTVLYLLSGTCAPLTTSTMPGDTLCSDDACGTSQSQIVALLKPGKYKLGITARGTDAGPVTVHAGWTLAPSGALKALAKGSSTPTGTTTGPSGNIDSLSSSCIGAASEDGYWWTTCPADPGGTLTASTCGDATWESILYLLTPGSTAPVCRVDTCGFQAQLSTAIPAVAGLYELVVDGQTATASGSYSMPVTRP